MFSDPQTITVNAVAKVMARVSSTGNSSVYQNADGSFKMTISHQTSTVGGSPRVRTMVRVDQLAIVADPLTSVNDYETLSDYFVTDRPAYGFSATQVDQLAAAIDVWRDTASNLKLFGLES